MPVTASPTKRVRKPAAAVIATTPIKKPVVKVATKPAPVCVPPVKVKAKGKTTLKTPAEDLSLLLARYKTKVAELTERKKQIQTLMIEVEFKFTNDQAAIAAKHNLTPKELAKMVRDLKKAAPAA